MQELILMAMEVMILSLLMMIRSQGGKRVAELEWLESFGRGSCSHNLKKMEVGKKRERQK